MVNTIETPRLILRPWRADDLEELERLWACPALWLWGTSARPHHQCHSSLEYSCTTGHGANRTGGAGDSAMERG